MTDPASGSPDIHGYHAHVYFSADTLPIAEQLREKLSAAFPVEIGPNSGGAAGPHPIPQFQIIFKTPEFQTVVPWLMLNRNGLDVLIHPLTDDMVDDHTDYTLWLGTPVTLKIETLKRRGYSAALLPSA